MIESELEIQFPATILYNQCSRRPIDRDYRRKDLNARERADGSRDHPDTFGVRNLNADSVYIPFAKHAAFFELAAEVARDGCHGLHFGQARDTRDAALIG